MSDLTSPAIKAAMKNDWGAAIKLNLEIIKNDKEDVDAWCRLARAYIESGKKDLAAKTVRQILKLNPYNPIAQKLKLRLEIGPGNCLDQHSNLIEEPGKTKTVGLANISSPKALSTIDCGQVLILEPKRHTVLVNDSRGKYLGALPDDIGKRLNILIKAGNCYECLAKSVAPKEIIVFLREVKRCKKYADFASFPSKYNPSEHRDNPKSDDLPVFTEDQPKAKIVEDAEEDDVPLASTIHQDEESEAES